MCVRVVMCCRLLSLLFAVSCVVCCCSVLFVVCRCLLLFVVCGCLLFVVVCGVWIVGCRGCGIVVCHGLLLF